MTAAFAVLLAGCASGPRSGDGATSPGRSASDGPPDVTPVGLERTPDAEPKVEPLRSGGPNKPYAVLGQSYSPETRDVPLREQGLASWYGRRFHGRRTASGEVYNMYAMTAAHKTMPLPSYARVRNPANGREIVVRVNDRGPFHAGRIIDLSYAAAVKLGVHGGVGRVEVERLTYEDIRTGAWRREPGSAPATEVASASREGVLPTGSVRPVAAAEGTAAPAAAAERETGPQTVPAPGTDAAPGTSSSQTAAAGPPVADGAPARAATQGARGYWVQLGAFRERAGAEGFHRRVSAELDWLSPLMAVFDESPLFRLQAGPYVSRGEAQDAAQRVRDALQLVPVIIERR